MPVLLDLPSEILREVFKLLTSGDLAKVCLTSSKLQCIAERVLYTAVCLSPSSTQMFLSTILNRPRLAALVLHLHSNWDTISTAITPGLGPLSANDLGLAMSRARSLGLNQPKSQLWHFSAAYQHASIIERYDISEWPQVNFDSFTMHYNLILSNSPRRILEWDDKSSLLKVPPELLQLGPESLQLEAVQVVLILHLLPALRTLESALPQVTDPERSEFLDVILEEQLSISAKRLPVGLQSLCEIRGSVGPHTCRVTLKMLLAMMKMPSIRKIKVRMAEVETDPAKVINTIFAVNRKISSVTELDLDDCYMSAATLDEVLQVPQALTHLSLRITGDFLGGSDSALPGIAIGHLRKTLQYLSLQLSNRTIYDGREDDMADGEGLHSIGSLCRWPQLRTVRTSLLPLLAQTDFRLGNVLPAVIRELTIDNSELWSCMATVDEVIDLVSHKEFYGVSGLAVVNISRWMVFGRRLERLIAACDAGGVQLRLLETDQTDQIH